MGSSFAIDQNGKLRFQSTAFKERNSRTRLQTRVSIKTSKKGMIQPEKTLSSWIRYTQLDATRDISCTKCSHFVL